MRSMTTHSDIVRAAGSPDEVADKLGVSVHTVRSWIQRNSVPVHEWRRFEALGWATVDTLFATRRTKRQAA